MELDYNERNSESTKEFVGAGSTKQRNNDSKRSHRYRSRTSIAFLPTELGTVENSAILEGSYIAPITRRISVAEETVLGSTPVGTRIFLRNGRRSNRGNDQGIYRETLK